jgi:hypothetical protein
MIYFIKAGKHIKVGYTKDVNTFKVRLSTYNTSNPFEMEIINLIDASRKMNLNLGKISEVCKGTRNHTGGYTFKYLEND